MFKKTGPFQYIDYTTNIDKTFLNQKASCFDGKM